MPKVKRSRKPPPDGWELIEPTLDELDQKMREGTQQSWVLSGVDTSNELWDLHEYKVAFVVSVPAAMRYRCSGALCGQAD